MEALPRRKLNLTRTLKNPNRYTMALEGEFSEYAFSEERAPLKKGVWREEVFKKPADFPMDVELGTGNGAHFGHRAHLSPNRAIVGLELKYKPLVQAIRRARKSGYDNAAMCRFHAHNIDELFTEGEIDNVYIHFPDPWTSPKKPKNRIVNRHLLAKMFALQKPGSFLEFKTDSREAFLWCREEIAASQYVVEKETLDLHKSPYVEGNFVTFFESIFVREQTPINYILLRRP